MAVFEMENIHRSDLLIQLNGVWLPGLVLSHKTQAGNRKGHTYNAEVLKQYPGLHQPNPS